MNWLDQKTAQNSFFFFFFFDSPAFHQTENIFHLILVGFMSSSPPCSDHAITSLKSLLKTFIQAYFHQTFIQREFPRNFWKQPFSSVLLCSSLFVCLLLSISNRYTVPAPLRYLTPTAHASISSSASISQSVTACLFIQLELFWEPRAPLMCVSACRERPLCTMFTFFPNSDSFCAPQWSRSAVQTVRSAMSRLIRGGHKHC